MDQANLEDRVTELELQLEESNKKAQAAESEAAELKAEVKKLQEKNAKFENLSFTHGEEEYEILAKNANVPGFGTVTASDIAASEDLQNALIAKQSGIIRKKA